MTDPNLTCEEVIQQLMAYLDHEIDGEARRTLSTISKLAAVASAAPHSNAI